MEQESITTDLTWEDVELLCTDLTTQIQDLNIDLLVGIARGGLVPATILSHNTGIPLETIVWQTMDGEKREWNKEVVDAIESGKNVMFIDELNDSGGTLNEISDAYATLAVNNNVYFGVLNERYSTKFKPSNYIAVSTIHDDKWLCYPWEIK